MPAVCGCVSLRSVLRGNGGGNEAPPVGGKLLKQAILYYGTSRQSHPKVSSEGLLSARLSAPVMHQFSSTRYPVDQGP